MKLVEDPVERAQTYSKAIQTIDPESAFGQFSQIWIGFALFYEEIGSSLDESDDSLGNLENSNLIFQKATQIKFKSIDEVANVYVSWA